MKYENIHLSRVSGDAQWGERSKTSKLQNSICHLIIVISIITALSCFADITLAEPEVGNSEYLLGSGDKIQIRVYGEDDLSMESFLSDSGVINYPFLGEIEVEGLTTTELETVIERGLKDGYLIKPIVHISVLEYRPFFIDGEVEVPGGYPYQPGLTIEKAVALAKGFTERAAKGKISIIRGEGESRLKIQVDLSTELRPGDIITVEQRFF